MPIGREVKKLWNMYTVKYSAVVKKKKERIVLLRIRAKITSFLILINIFNCDFGLMQHNSVIIYDFDIQSYYTLS